MGNKIKKIGILHSLTGSMAFSESPLVNAAKLAIDEINESGGILGHKIDPIIIDGESNPNILATKVTEQIEKRGIDTFFGCWRSSSRRAVKSILEKLGGQLWYPLPYEGLEESPNIFYMGNCLNQQILPALDWCKQKGFQRKFFLGSDCIYSRTCNKFIQSESEIQSSSTYTGLLFPEGHSDFSKTILKIKAKKPDIILTALNCNSNEAFFQQYADSDISSLGIPILSFSLSESKLRKGHYACMGYFQCLSNQANQKFIQAFSSRYGKKNTYLRSSGHVLLSNLRLEETCRKS